MTSRGASDTPSEATTVHTRILRVTLAVDDCTAYWRHASDERSSDLANAAFQGRWFGPKSEARVRTLLGDMTQRFDVYPEALRALQRWGNVPVDVRPLICHWHTQLADPVYRRFSGELLPTRRAHGLSTADREVVARWIDEVHPGRWARATSLKFGANLLSTAYEAGLVKSRRDPRALTLPAVPDRALAYVVYLLRGVRYEGTLFDNPYLRSVGLDEAETTRRLLRVPGISYRGLGSTHDIEWEFAGIEQWARATCEEAA